jgi:hypothetical protein
MAWNWYELFSLPEFLATGLVSRTLTFTLTGIGETEILITRGNKVGIVFQDTFLVIEEGGKNPFVRGTCAVFKDDSENIWLGVQA